MQSRRRNFADRFSPEYRKFGRGGGSRRRGPHNSPPPTLYLPAPPLRRRAEVLKEAGRLAAEYLAAKGLLPAIPASASTGAEKWWPKGGDDEVDRASAFSRLGRRKIDGDDGGFRTKRRVRRRRHRGESHRRHDSDRGKEDAGAPHWAMDTDDLEKPWRFQGRERRFPDAIDDGESDRRSLSEESDGGNGDPDQSKTLRSPLDHDQLLRSKDETTDESENESGAKAMESSETRAAPDPVPDSETNSKAESKELQKEETGENAEIPPSSSEGNMNPDNDEIEENSREESKIKPEEQTNLPSASFKTCDLNSIEAPEATTSATLERETSSTTIFQQKANPAVVINLEDEPDSSDRIIGGSEADPQNLEVLGGIQDGYGIDDTLFMSIGDIPINFMDVWDQAPGEYGKFF